MTDSPPPALLPKRPTMADVAASAGVSRSLVSTVFRGVPGASAETRQRVFKSAEDLGYQMDNRARLLRRSRTKTLGVLFRLPDAFQADLVEALHPAAKEAGYDLVLSATTTHRSESEAVDSLLKDRTEGLVLLSPQVSDDELAAIAARTPTVVIARRTPGPFDSVRTPDNQVVRTAFDHLHGLGHRNIAHVDGGPFHGAQQRRRSYRSLMQRRGIGEYVNVLPGSITEDSGLQAARMLLAQDGLPTGVIAWNDRCAVGLMFELRHAGVRVPEDVSVVGYDDVSMAALPFIDLTTVGQNATATAELSIARAVARLDAGEPGGQDNLVAPYFVERSTTAPPR